VLSRGHDRGDFADAFLWAVGQLGASAYHMRLPAPWSASGAWAVGDSKLAANPLAVEALKAVDMVVDLTFLLFSPEQFAIQAYSGWIPSCPQPAAGSRQPAACLAGGLLSAAQAEVMSSAAR